MIIFFQFNVPKDLHTESWCVFELHCLCSRSRKGERRAGKLQVKASLGRSLNMDKHIAHIKTETKEPRPHTAAGTGGEAQREREFVGSWELVEFSPPLSRVEVPEKICMNQYLRGCRSSCRLALQYLVSHFFYLDCISQFNSDCSISRRSLRDASLWVTIIVYGEIEYTVRDS